MCKLMKRAGMEEFEGWKLVAEKDGKYYSLAMGFCYNDHNLIPVVVVQHRLWKSFSDDILTSSFDKQMEGRTAVFHTMEDLEYEFPHWKNGYMWGLSIVAKKVRVSVDLMMGIYGLSPVIAGRKLEFLEEKL